LRERRMGCCESREPPSDKTLGDPLIDNSHTGEGEDGMEMVRQRAGTTETWGVYPEVSATEKRSRDSLHIGGGMNPLMFGSGDGPKGRNSMNPMGNPMTKDSRGSVQPGLGWSSKVKEDDAQSKIEMIMEGGLQHDGKEKKMLSIGSHLSSWSEGWFELFNTHLQFRNEKNGPVTKRLALDKGYTTVAPDVETHESSVFRIVTEGNEFSCKASSDAEMVRWVDGLQAAISGCHPCIKEGYMKKQGSTVATWKRRYFLLFTDGLVYLDRDEGTCSD
jgi:hypothetical protein